MTMPAFAILGLDWLHVAVYGEGALILALLLAVRVLWVSAADLDERFRRARRERDDAKEVLAVIRRMSEIRVKTVTRMRGFQ
jgi:hypothetical protein